MGVIKKKPYEISVWEDRLVTENDISYYKEIKLAVIGSDKMESPNRAFDPVLTENVNGEKTLTFSLAYKYHDEYTGEIITNPFYGYLINERKVKLFYNDEWSEFVIKECEESSTENIFKYTAKELFSLELAKLGYNVTLDTELNNNQGTIIELAQRVLENTDWEVDEDNSDLLTQYVQEPLYQATISNEITVLNLDTNEPFIVEEGETIYIFYSFIENKTTDYVQFIREEDRNNFFIDDDNVIKSTNYRITSSVNYIINPTTQQVTEIEGIATIEGTYLSNQGYRLVYKIQTTYDPVMDRTVDIYQMSYGDGAKEIYHFLDYNYTTSDIVVSYMTNGSDFQLYEDGKLQGWYNTTPTSLTDKDFPVLQSIGTTTYPALDSSNPLVLINDLSELNGYLELKFNGALTEDYENTFFNLGFEHNRSIIDHISKGEEFVLRTRYYTSDTKHGDLVAGNPIGNDKGLRIIVAKYETIEQECYIKEDAKGSSKIKAYKILPDDIILEFDGDFIKSPNVISNGTFDDKHKQYLVDKVVQTPSMAYVYKEKGDDTEYIWNPKKKLYVPKQDAEIAFADYYLTTAQAKYSFTNEQMDDPAFKMGIFVYTKDSELASKYIYLEDIQLTRCYRDGNEEIVTLGNVPTAVSAEAHHYYLKPTTQKTEKEITTYGSLDFLANELGVNRNAITPVFNENSEKILSIQASNSNYFNILQDLCETFECWLDIRVEHDEDGSITLDENYNPIKKIAFKEYAGKDNFAGFKNGINLNGITRNIDSNEIVTKLIVEPVQSEYTDSGSVDIQRAQSNSSGQSYILNFSYYINRGLITNVEQCNEDINKHYKDTKAINNSIVAKEDEYRQATDSLTKISAQRNTYTALIEEADRHYNEALEDFQKITNWDYNAFASEYQNIEEWAKKQGDKGKDYLENDTVLDIVGEIYISKVTSNNYSGILTNIDKAYQDLSLKCYGAKEYGISVVYVPGDGMELQPSTQVTIDDYISGLQFELIDTNGSTVLYHTSPNERIFNIFNAVPYKIIRFLQLPENYNLVYYKRNGDEAVVTKNELGIPFKIYDDTTGETYDRRFELAPTEEYLTEHKGLQQEIDELIEEKVQIEKDFYKKYSRFLQEGTWSSQDYIDSELYYFDALQVSDTSAQPKVSYTIDVLEVSQIDGFENYDFRVGDKTYIEDTDFFGYLYQSVNVSNLSTLEQNESPQIISARSPVREEVIVSEVEWHFDEPDNNTITVQNYKTRFEDLFQRISATVQTVERNEITYPKTSSILDQSGLINSTLLADSLNGIGGVGFALTTNGSVAATEDGLLIRDLLNPSNVMRVASSGIQVSTDGGSNWGTAISAAGISTDTLTAGTINTQRIWLMDGDNPSFRWDKAGLNAYGLDENGNESYDLKTYVRFDKYGLYGIKNGEDYVASSLSDVRDKAFFGVTWDGFFIKNSYANGGEVSITSDEDIVVKGNNGNKRIWIGAVEKDRTGAPTKYGINIMNDDGDIVFDTGDDGNIAISGTINALAGNFLGQVNVGEPDNTHIIIDGSLNDPTISSSNYSDGAGTGWIINSAGDATFSNVSVRGAIKTAVFEYEEIQAVGGAFLFRPSSSIKNVRYIPLEEPTEEIGEEGEVYTVDYYNYNYDLTTDITVQSGKIYYQKVDGEDKYERVLEPRDEDIDTYYERGDKVYNDLLVTVEKPLMFTKNNWVKLSNYNEQGGDPNLSTYGLVHIYEISDIIIPDESTEEDEEDENEPAAESEYEAYEIVLSGGTAILDSVALESIIGGALIDFGNHKTGTDKQGQTIDVPGDHNYGIGINSSDNYVNLPARAISLFETTIHPDATTKVTYDYRGILGTLPNVTGFGLGSIYKSYLENTQGIYTDNMYIGDASHYLAFYTDTHDLDENNIPRKKLRISGADIIFTYNDGTETGTIDDIINEIEVEGSEGLVLTITSSNGTQFNTSTINTTLTATVYENGEVISDISSLGVLNWYIESINSVYIGTNDITVDITKTYYKYNLTTNNYEVVVSPIDVDIENYYERKNQTTGTECKVGATDIANIVVKLEDISELGG